MIYESPFNIGDKVYTITMGSRPVWADCPMCNGKGKITINDFTEKCPKCWGRGGNREYVKEGWRVERKMHEERDSLRCIELDHLRLTIGQVMLVHTKGKPPRWEAMCKEYGIGSGTIFDMSKFFATVEDAQAECDRLNALGEA